MRMSLMLGSLAGGILCFQVGPLNAEETPPSSVEPFKDQRLELTLRGGMTQFRERGKTPQASPNFALTFSDWEAPAYRVGYWVSDQVRLKATYIRVGRGSSIGGPDNKTPGKNGEGMIFMGADYFLPTEFLLGSLFLGGEIGGLFWSDGSKLGAIPFIAPTAGLRHQFSKRISTEVSATSRLFPHSGPDMVRILEIGWGISYAL